ncbi:MAG: hypothetical protein ACXADD_18815 [Candidatus Thorarchaeota archaeon]
MGESSIEEEKESTGTEEETVEVEDRIKYASLIAGVLIAASLVISDYLLIRFGADMISILAFQVNASLLISTLFIASLVGGYFVGKAKLTDSALLVLMFGGTWTISLIAGYLAASSYGLIETVATVSAFLLGGLGLGSYRYIQGDKGVDGLFQIALLASTALNFLYYALLVVL